MNNITVHDLEKNCCGCSACINICPVGAIKKSRSSQGFYIPSVDESKCINCGICKELCRIGKTGGGFSPVKKYAAVINNNDLIMSSSSGGACGAIISALYDKYPGLHCFGAAWGEDMTLIHRHATSQEECVPFKGSKYVQSDLLGTFSIIGRLLSEGEHVLFIGTGCQCAGLRAFISQKRIDDGKMTVIDLICHGVPSDMLWKDYLAEIEKKNAEKGRVVAYTFRNKEEGWHGLHPRALFENGEGAEKDNMFLSYGRLFGNLSLNRACYSCQYASTERFGDITLGDYWGIEKSDCPIDRKNGVSLCLINTKKGEEIFEMTEKSLIKHIIDDDSYLQPQLCHPVSENVLCDRFRSDYVKHGYAYVAKKYTGHSRAHRAAMKFTETIIKKLRRK